MSFLPLHREGERTSRFETVAIADDADLHIVLVKVRKIVADKEAQQAQKVADFRLWARPVFRN